MKTIAYVCLYKCFSELGYIGLKEFSNKSKVSRMFFVHSIRVFYKLPIDVYLVMNHCRGS